MPAALVIPAVIGAAGSVAGAGIAAYSANKAAKTQAAAASSALDLQKQMYDQSRLDRQPWVTTGGQAATTLGALMGLGGPVNGQRLMPNGGTNSDQSDAITLGGAMRAPSPTGLPQGARTPALQNGREPADLDTVMLAAPDGTRQAVPRRFMQHYITQGATLVQ